MQLNRSRLNTSTLNIWLRRAINLLWGHFITVPHRVYSTVMDRRVMIATAKGRVWAVGMDGRVWTASASPRNYSIIMPQEPENVR